MSNHQKTPKITIECAGGCGKTVTLRKSKVQKADYYVCNTNCEQKIPQPPNTIKNFAFNAAGSFSGITFKQITKEDQKKLNNATRIKNLGLKTLRIKTNDPKDPFLIVTQYLSNPTNKNNHYFTILYNEKVYTFGKDNFHYFHLCMQEVREVMLKTNNRHVVFICRRFEEGPKDPLTNLPYKTIAAIVFLNENWFAIDEEEMKNNHRTDPKTGKPIKPEPSCLFCHPVEMFPGLKNYLKTHA